MREIEFKAKRVDNGKWVYGDLIHGVNHKAGKMYILPILGGVISMSGCDPLDGHEVIPETVCQWTGLLDENGVKIYEGDMLEFSDGQKSVVRWMQGGLTCQADFGDYDYTNIGWAIEILGGCEIKGNIHDKAQQKQALIDMMRGDKELGLYDE